MPRPLLTVAVTLSLTLPTYADTLRKLRSGRTLTNVDVLRLDGDRLRYRLASGSELAADVADLDLLAIDAAPTFENLAPPDFGSSPTAEHRMQSYPPHPALQPP